MDELSKDLAEMEKETVAIPGWPNLAVMTIKLGRKEFFLPVRGENGLLEVKRVKLYVTCKIDRCGCVTFNLSNTLGRMPEWLNISLSILTCFVFLLVYIGLEKTTSDYSIGNLTDVILFRQFHEEILSQTEKFLPHIKARHDAALGFLKEAINENKEILGEIKRAKDDLDAGMERVRMDLGETRGANCLGFKDEATETFSAPTLPPTPESLKN